MVSWACEETKRKKEKKSHFPFAEDFVRQQTFVLTNELTTLELGTQHPIPRA